MIQKDGCCGCGACVLKCPKTCIKMEENTEGFLYPIVDIKECIQCGLCRTVCPTEQEKGQVTDPELFSYAVINTNDDERKNSSSGGVFSALAKWTIENEGVVFGAALSDDKKTCVHIMIDRIEEIEKLQGSKYLQSSTNLCFQQARTMLEKNRKVLYTGTPCQIEGLLLFLNKEYDNLICVDLICHGVSSPKAWRIYLEESEQKASSKVKKVLFREKTDGWKNSSLFVSFENGHGYRQNIDRDAYMISFLKNVNLRHSCYACQFKGINRKSDITIGDFWGAEKILPRMDDGKGTSLVLIHNAKGYQIFNMIKDCIKFEEVDIDDALQYNPAVIQSAYPHPKRAIFFKKLGELPYDKLVQKYVMPKRTVKKICGNFLRTIGCYDWVKSLIRRE